MPVPSPAAVSLSPNVAPAAPAAQPGGAGPASPDFNGLAAQLAESQRTLAETRQQFGALNERYTADSKVIDGLRQLFNPQKQQAPSRVEHYNSRLDHYLQAAVQAEREGRPMPLTANLAAEFYEHATEVEQLKSRWEAEIAALKQQVQKASDPSEAINLQAYTNMDSHLQNALNTIYGPGAEYADQKEAQFEALGKVIGKEIRELAQEDPQAWDNIRRSPAKQQKLVMHFVEQSLPPRARQILAQEQLMNEPTSMDELIQAFNEASAIQDDRERAQVKGMIRREILAMKMGRGGPQQQTRGGRGYGRQPGASFRRNTSMSQLYRAS